MGKWHHLILAGILGSFGTTNLAWTAEQAKAELPLSKLVLFNAGVGYFERLGTIEGHQSVELQFKEQQINDLLKSLFAQDLDGGTIPSIHYASNESLDKTLQSFAVDLSTPPSLGVLLNQLRGETVEYSPKGEQGRPKTGTIVGVEQREEKDNNGSSVTTEYLTVLNGAVLQRVRIDNIESLLFENEAINRDLQAALGVLKKRAAKDKKPVAIEFAGDGKRRVRVGYIQQTPVWKTSYRLVLRENEAPFLQGWAIVENTSDDDWKQLDLRLISGRPIAFTMDLYQPLYTQRPSVAWELFHGLSPQLHDQTMQLFAGSNLVGQRALGEASAKFGRIAANAKSAKDEETFNRQSYNRALGVMDSSSVPAEGIDTQGVDFIGSSPAVAEAADVGEMFEYHISAPVDLARQQSAMLPIVQGTVQADKVAIYNPRVQPKHPLLGLRLKNSTNLHLMQGPITVFDANNYAGDARLDDLAAGGERLISYALDVDTEVVSKVDDKPQEIVAIKLVQGVLEVSRKQQIVREYAVKNSGKRTKDLLIEEPTQMGWKMTAPTEKVETTRDRYRIPMKIEPNQLAKLQTQSEHVQVEKLEVRKLNDEVLLSYATSNAANPKVKGALQEIIRRQKQIAQLTVDRGKIEAKRTALSEEQNRMRQNMGYLDRTNDLYLSYVNKLKTQEGQIESILKEMNQISDDLFDQQKALEEYLKTLDLA